MNGLLHMTNPRYYTSDGRPIKTKEGRKGHVHYVQEGEAKSLCGLSNVWQLFGKDTQVPLMFEVPEPADCLACIKALEMVVRPLLRDLSGAGLEKVLLMIQALRNGDLKS